MGNQMNKSQNHTVLGAVGNIEVAVNLPNPILDGACQQTAIALIAHPHPLFGGTMENKVAQTLARTFSRLGYISVRSNFRGVGNSEGVHDHGVGETDDLERVLDWARTQFQADGPVVLAGFSFGTYVHSLLAPRLVERGIEVERMVMVGTAAGKWPVQTVPKNSIVIHGERDDTIPLEDVLRWAEPQDLPVSVLAGADHFFHRRLGVIEQIIVQQWPKN
jgi:uncharacterized protein